MNTLLSRRTVVRAFPFLGAAIATPLIIAKELQTAPDDNGTLTQRADKAMTELKRLFGEIYGCTVEDQSAQQGERGCVIVLAALPHPMDRVTWRVDDGSPLLPNQEKWAKWQADYARLAPAGRA